MSNRDDTDTEAIDYFVELCNLYEALDYLADHMDRVLQVDLESGAKTVMVDGVAYRENSS